MKREFNRKGVSPIISTSILIVIVIILAIIILLWAKGFVKEAVLKEIAGNEKRAEDFCREVKMRAILNEDNSFGFENTGSIPIFKYKLKLESNGGSSVRTIEKSVNPGYSSIVENEKYSDYESVKIIPILLGKVKGNTQEYECPEVNGVDV